MQQNLLTDDMTALRQDEERLSEISSAYEEALEALPEEEKDKDFVNEDKTAFAWAEVKKAIKAKEVDEEVMPILKKALADNEEEKKLKKRIKERSAALQISTKEAIESLSDEQAYGLLREKWVAPLVNGLSDITDHIIADFVTKLQRLAEKYNTTLSEVETQITETAKELSDMLDMLTGNEFDMQGLAELKKMLGGI